MASLKPRWSQQGCGWREAPSGAGNMPFRCRKSGLDSDWAIDSDAMPRADWNRSLRHTGTVVARQTQSNPRDWESLRTLARHSRYTSAV